MKDQSRKTPAKKRQPKKDKANPLVLTSGKWAIPKEGFLSEAQRTQYATTTAVYDAIFEDAVRVAEQEIYAIEDWPTSKAVVASRVMAAIRRLKLS